MRQEVHAKYGVRLALDLVIQVRIQMRAPSGHPETWCSHESNHSVDTAADSAFRTLPVLDDTPTSQEAVGISAPRVPKSDCIAADLVGWHTVVGDDIPMALQLLAREPRGAAAIGQWQRSEVMAPPTRPGGAILALSTSRPNPASTALF